MKIATWNVNSLRIRMEHVLRWWDEHQPEILLLQETKVADELFPHEPFTERNLFVAAHGQKSYNGVAIISRLPLEDVKEGFNGHIFEDHARLLTATAKAPNGDVRVATAYVPNGQSVDSPKFLFKEQFYTHMTKWAKEELSRHPEMVVGGDFNISWDERDVDNVEKRSKECMFTPAERDWLKTFADAGYVDAFREVSEEAGVFSWWDYRQLAFVQNRGMRIDYLFVSEVLKGRIGNVTHHRDERKQTQPSDHIPVVVELKD